MNQRPARPRSAGRARGRNGGPHAAGLQARGTLSARRWLVLALNLATLAALLLGLAQVLGAGGWSAADIVIFIAFLSARHGPCSVSGMR